MGRPSPTMAAVTVVVILQLLSDALAEGRLVGHAELVRTGERVAIRRTDELVTFLCNGASAHPSTPIHEKELP